jgi:hypothetical protein
MKQHGIKIPELLQWCSPAAVYNILKVTKDFWDNIA